eukprot:1903216-Rhodomonas_salina.1
MGALVVPGGAGVVPGLVGEGDERGCEPLPLVVARRRLRVGGAADQAQGRLCPQAGPVSAQNSPAPRRLQHALTRVSDGPELAQPELGPWPAPWDESLSELERWVL